MKFEVVAKDKEEEVMLRYLMGEATDAERTRVEKQAQSDDDYSEALYALEDALVDEYVMGRMPAGQRKAFEANMTASQHENVAFTRELVEELIPAVQRETVRVARRGLKKKPEEGVTGISASAAWWHRLRNRIQASAFLQVAVAFVCVLILVGLPALFWLSSLRSERDQARQEAAVLRQQRDELNAKLTATEDELRGLTAELAAERKSSSEAQDQLAQLRENIGISVPGLQVVQLRQTITTRGPASEANAVKVKADTKRVQFNVPLDRPPKYSSYAVSITLGEKTVMEFPGLKRRPGANKVSVTIPAELLEYDDYILKLFGEQEGKEPQQIAAYTFRINK